MRGGEIWRFETERFTIRLLAEAEQYPDLSWRDAEQIAYDRDHGVTYYIFSVVVDMDDREIARDTLGNSGYVDPADFAREHRDPDPMNRNCSLMRDKRGAVVIGHYFPDMVRAAICEARQHIDSLQPPPRLRHNGLGV